MFDRVQKKTVMMGVASLVLVTGWVLLAGCAPSAAPTPANQPAAANQDGATQRLSNVPDRSVRTITIDDQPFEVEVVNTPASVTLGLSGREAIGHDGMLFVLPQRRQATFWMKDMLFDLDIVWIDGSEVVHLTPDVPAPAPNVSLNSLPKYASQVPVTHVLELPAGKAREMGITVGSIIGHHAMME